jgi:hypothetical protein
MRSTHEVLKNILKLTDPGQSSNGFDISANLLHSDRLPD